MVAKLPDERIGMLFVFRTFDRVSYALILSSQDPVKPGDRFLLCSDGLTDGLWDYQIEEVLRATTTPGKSAENSVTALTSTVAAMLIPQWQT